MARALMAVGVPAARAYSLARRVENDLAARGVEVADFSRLEELAVEILGEEQGGEALRQLRRYREQASRFTPQDLAALHGRVVEADRALKGGVAGDVLLPTLVAVMAGRPEAALDVEIRTSR